jgi:hypothetical protein
LFDAGFVPWVVEVPVLVMNPVPKVVVVELAPSFPLVMLPLPNFDVVDDAPELSRLM